MKRTYRAVGTLVGLMGILSLSACGSSGSSSNPNASSSQPSGAASSPASSVGSSSSALPTAAGSVTIGSADFPESTLLADIYGDAMSAKGVKVTKHLNIGARGVYMAALKDGSIGAMPEYTGSILSYLDKGATAKTPDQVFAALEGAAAKQGLVATQYAPAQDSDTITVTKTTAAKDKLTSIADLAPIAGKLTFGAPAQFHTLADGI